MEIRIFEREQFTLCGWAVETNAENNDADISHLFRDFFESGKEKTLTNLLGCKKGLYGLSWYTLGHERYCYLLGKETEHTASVPEGAQIKTVPSSLFAVAYIQNSAEVKTAWTEFFFSDIPQNGLSPNEEHGLYFEYYPDSVYGACELWVPVKTIESK